MEQVWNRNHKEIVGDTSLEMLKMPRAPGIQIYRVTALPTARELELDGNGIYGPSNPICSKIL